MKKIISAGNGTVIKSYRFAVVREDKPLGKYYLLREYWSFYLCMAGIVTLAVLTVVLAKEAGLF